MPRKKIARDAVPEHTPKGRKFSAQDKADLLRMAGRTRTYERRAEFSAALDKIAQTVNAFDWDMPSLAARAQALKDFAGKVHRLRHALNALSPIVQADLDHEAMSAHFRGGEPMDGAVEVRAMLERAQRNAEDAASRLTAESNSVGRHDELKRWTIGELGRLWDKHATKSRTSETWRHFVARGIEALGYSTVNPDDITNFDKMCGKVETSD